jgi:hypothetical protein
MPQQRLEQFKNEFLTYFDAYVLIAEFDAQENLIVISKPYLDFEVMVSHLCKSLVQSVGFQESLMIQVYQFGRNEFISIALN